MFISSPCDVAEERQLARDLIDRLNKDHLVKGRVELEAVSWDDPDAPTSMPINLTPQEAVNRGLAKPSACDIVIVLFWNRMGTELDRSEGVRANGEPYRSGTEWELEDALNAPTRPDRPVILLYRRTGFTPDASDPDDPKLKEQLDQRRKVNAFFQELRQKKRLAVEVAGPNEFEGRLENDLKHQIRLILDRQPELKAEPSQQTEPVTQDPMWRGSPYPGLRPFEEADAPVFFGRGVEVEALLARLGQPDTSLLIVIGASGSGKSSLVRAGLIPRLRAGGLPGSGSWKVLEFKPTDPGDDPFRSLAIKLNDVLPASKREAKSADLAAKLEATPGALLDCVAALSGDGGRVVLFIDQFEELFTPAGARKRDGFIDLLTRVASEPSLLVLATLRADFFEEASKQGLANLLSDGTFALAPPGPTALIEMIRHPGAAAGVEVPDDVVDAILEDVGSGEGALPLVAFCLSELWPQEQDSKPQLTLVAYKALGRLRGAIERRSGQILHQLSEAERDALPDLFRQLIHVNSDGTATRRRVNKSTLNREPGVAPLAKALVDGRLLLASG